MKTLHQNLISRIYFFISITTFFFILQGCTLMAPVTTSVESAKMISKGKVEGSVIRSAYSSNVYQFNSSTDMWGNLHINTTKTWGTLNKNYGFRILKGGNKINIGFHYERMKCKNCEVILNYFSIEPKFRLKEKKIFRYCFFSSTGNIFT